jgi:hypothetical protein
MSNRCGDLAGRCIYTSTFQSTRAEPKQQNVVGLLGTQYEDFISIDVVCISQFLFLPGLSDLGRMATTRTSVSVKLSNNSNVSILSLG